MKKALLDTDFIFKTQIARNGNQKLLADLVIGFEEYEFFCHEKILAELSFHTLDPDPIPWLKDKIERGIVKCLSDYDILHELENDFGKLAPRLYMDLLKVSCDSFSLSFFNRFYRPLSELADNADSPVFLSELKNCEMNIGNGNSMGEKKLLSLHRCFS